MNILCLAGTIETNHYMCQVSRTVQRVDNVAERVLSQF